MANAMRYVRTVAVVFLMVAISSAWAGGLPAVQRSAAAVYLLHEGGELRLDVLKRDLNIYDGEDLLTYRLVGPGWRILREGSVRDDGNAGKGARAEKAHRESLTMPGLDPGLYTLQLRPSGHDMLFGFDTGVKRFVVQGDINFSDTETQGKVYFPAPPQWAKFEMNAIHQFPFEMRVLDGAGKEAAAFHMPSREKKDAVYTVPGELRGGEGMWSIEATSMDYAVKFLGKRMGYWTTDPKAWFDADAMRWIVYPKRQKAYVEAGASTVMEVTLRNDAAGAKEFDLRVETPRHLKTRLLVPKPPVRVEGKGAEKTVRIEIAAPADMATGASDGVTFHATRTDDALMTERCDIAVQVGRSPVGNALDLPIVLKFYEHENVQFGYRPEYDSNAVYFDLQNRPFIRDRGGERDSGGGQTMHVFDGLKWDARSLVDAIRELHPTFKDTLFSGGWLPEKVVFDKDGDGYTYLKVTLADGRMRCVLLHGTDGFRKVRAYDLPVSEPDRKGGRWALWGTTEVELEQFTGHNVLDGPPPILLYHRTAPHPATWCSIFDVKIMTGHKVDGRLEFDEPVLVTRKSGGVSQHSGGAASTATRDGKTHIIWWEVSAKDAPGVPTYIRTLDHKTRDLTQPVLIGHGAPVNDCHNQPGILTDSKGTIHALTGAHGRTFMYATSLKPNDATAFTKAAGVPARGHIRDDGTRTNGQTYLSMLCDSKDTLHISYRMHRMHADGYLDGGGTLNLTYQRKKAGAAWEMPRLMVRPPLVGYSNYHAKLTMDRRDRLFLSYNYLCHDSYYGTIMPGYYHFRAMMMSSDGGDAWRLVRNQDFADGMK